MPRPQPEFPEWNYHATTEWLERTANELRKYIGALALFIVRGDPEVRRVGVLTEVDVTSDAYINLHAKGASLMLFYYDDVRMELVLFNGEEYEPTLGSRPIHQTEVG